VCFFTDHCRRKQPRKFDRVALLAQRWEKYEKVLLRLLKQNSQEAFACLVMAHTGLRVGNEDSAEGYVTKLRGLEGQTIQTFGLTTLRKEHVFSEGKKLILRFLGKKAVGQDVAITDPILIEYGKRLLAEIPGDSWLSVSDREVYRFFKRQIDPVITLKDLRTMCANAMAYALFEDTLADRPPLGRKSEVNKELKTLLETAATKLGNTGGVLKRSYMSPHFVEWFKVKRFDA